MNLIIASNVLNEYQLMYLNMNLISYDQYNYILAIIFKNKYFEIKLFYFLLRLKICWFSFENSQINYAPNYKSLLIFMQVNRCCNNLRYLITKVNIFISIDLVNSQKRFYLLKNGYLNKRFQINDWPFR